MFVPHKLSNYPSWSQAFNKYFSSSKMQLCILPSRMGTLPHREASHLISSALRVLERYIKEKDPQTARLALAPGRLSKLKDSAGNNKQSNCSSPKS